MRFQSSRDVIVRVPDLDAAVAFYQSQMGFSISFQGVNLVGFDTGAFTLYLDSGDPAHSAVFEMLVSDVRTARDGLVAAGCRVVEEDPAIPRCYIRDPQGLTFNIGSSR